MAKKKSAPAKTMDHEVFGTLTHVVSDLWERPIELVIFGRKWPALLRVSIDPDEGAERNQIAAYQTFSTKMPQLLAAAEKAVFEYYQSICEEARAQRDITDPDDELLPLIKKLEQVYPLVKLEGVVFPYARRRPTFGLLGECNWEEEHGLGIKFEEGKIVDVGFQDILL